MTSTLNCITVERTPGARLHGSHWSHTQHCKGTGHLLICTKPKSRGLLFPWLTGHAASHGVNTVQQKERLRSDYGQGHRAPVLSGRSHHLCAHIHVHTASI